MSGNWVVVGAGRQGPAVAYDMVKFGAPEQVTIADFDLSQASEACARINSLLKTEAVVPAKVDVRDDEGLRSFLSGFQIAVAAAPYHLNPFVSRAGIDVGCHVVDMGLDTPDALEIHDLDAQAKEQGVCVVTDCGVAPGLVNVLARKLIEEMPDATTVRLYCGGLPETAEAPYFHKVGFSVDSLLGEYVDDVYSLKDGEVVCCPALADQEVLEFAGIGQLEAVTTSGGTGTAPYSLPATVRDYEYKTLRHPGHWQAMTFMRDGGFWSEEMLPGGMSPRAVSLALMERAMVEPDYRDLVVTRVAAEGPSGKKAYDVVDRFDPQTGFTAMQRTTGFSTSIVALEIAAGRVSPGCSACECAVGQARFFEEAERRGIVVAPSG